MVVAVALAVGGTLILCLLLALVLTPRMIEYVETIQISAPADQLYDHIRLQERLMQWSAWPSVTKSTCAVEGPDGVVGARTAFFAKGRRFGHQEVVRLIENRAVELTLASAGPPHKPWMRFDLVPLSNKETEVRLHFRNDISPPFHLIQRLFGLVAWTRDMHRKDLAGLKRFAEPPHLTYTGERADLQRGP